MEEYIRWSLLSMLGSSSAEAGAKSRERQVQAERLTKTMAAFFHSSM